jgi:hypothetical protein
MTRQTFYRTLRRIAPQFRWKFDQDLRGYKNGDDFCPITAVYQAKYGGGRRRLGAYRDYGSALGLTTEDAEHIAYAADGEGNKQTIKALLRAVGIES